MFTAWKNENAFDLAPQPKPAASPVAEAQEVTTTSVREGVSGTQAPKEAYSIINEWLTMRGELESDGDVLVKGRVHGNLRCRSLIIDKGASVEGGVNAQEVIVRGMVRGTIRTKRIFLEKTAIVDCEVFQETFAAEKGARVKGTVRRTDDEPVKANAPLKQTTALASLGQSSVTELFRDTNNDTVEATKSTSSLYNMLDTARTANGAARRT